MRLEPDSTGSSNLGREAVIAIFTVLIAPELHKEWTIRRCQGVWKRSTHESQRVVQVRVVELDGNVVDPRLDSIGPPFSYKGRVSTGNALRKV